MYQRTTLPNGLRVVCETIPHVHSVSLGIWAGTGSRFEEPYYNGISHFAEHMFFKGTTHRNTRQIAETIDAVGGQLNAFTTKEYTCFYAKVLNQHFQLGIDLLSDMITNSVFAMPEIEKEKLVVMEEIKSYEDSPDELIHDLFVNQVLKGHPLGRSILGTPQTVRQIDRNALLDYLRNYYTPDNLVFAVAGNVQLDQIMPEIEARFAGLEGKADLEMLEIPSLEPGTIFKNKETEQVNICMGTRGISRKHPERYSVFVLDSILGGSVSSRLFQCLREEQGLVYATGSSHSSFRDTGIFSIYAGTSPGNLDLVIELITKELNRLCQEMVGPAELTRAKEQLKGNLLLSLESTCNRMSRLAKTEIYNDQLLTPEESVAKIEAVTSESILKIARELFDPKRLITTAIGPFNSSDTTGESL